MEPSDQSQRASSPADVDSVRKKLQACRKSGEKRKKDVKSQKNRKQYEKRKGKSKSTQAAVKPEAPLSFPDHVSSVGVGQSSMREDVVMADENQELKSGDGAPLSEPANGDIIRLAISYMDLFVITNFPLFALPPSSHMHARGAPFINQSDFSSKRFDT